MTKPAEPFNADTRARARETQPITVGDRQLFRVRRTPPVMRAFRAIVRQDQQLAHEFNGLELDDVEGRQNIEDKREDLMYEMARVFLKAKDGDEELAVEFLQENLDLEDLSDLLDELTPGDEPDPTPAATPQPTSG